MANGNQHGGKRKGAGRKSKAEELGLVALLDECFTVEERKKVIRVLVEAATRAPLFNIEAAKLLLAYTYGKPVDKQEHTGANGAPLLPPALTIVIDEHRQTNKSDAQAAREAGASLPEHSE